MNESIKQFFWFLNKKITLFEGQGLYSKVKVTKQGDRTNLYTNGKFVQTSINTKVTPRGTYIDHYLVPPWFIPNFNGTIKKMLILGFGGGSQAKYYNQIYKVDKIIGVEIDPIIVEVSKKYFDLDKNVELVCSDASNYLNTSNDLFEVIIVDCFRGENFETSLQQLESFNLVKNRMSPKSVFVLNKLKQDKSNDSCEKNLKTIFKTVIKMSVYSNYFFVCLNGNYSEDISEASKFNKSLRFSDTITWRLCH